MPWSVAHIRSNLIKTTRSPQVVRFVDNLPVFLVIQGLAKRLFHPRQFPL
jgi:hypothetical protein